MIDIIGLGVSGFGSSGSVLLSQSALLALEKAQLVIGSERQLEVISLHFNEQKQYILPPLKDLGVLINDNKDKSIVVLASGDPLHYGIGRWLVKKFGIDSLKFHPGISSMQAACHLLGKSLQDVEVLSLHGRPLSNIRRSIKANKTLVILTDKNSQPTALAKECIDAGFAQSSITVIENIGYPQQELRVFSAQALADDSAFKVEPLHVSVVEVKGNGEVFPEFPGFEDHLFVTGEEPGKGMITKREVRLAILSLLQAKQSDVIWDIGAGCGSVSIELAYWQRHAKVYAVEHHQQRLLCLNANREKFGVTDNITVIEGRAPELLSQLPKANKVFIGGSDGELLDILANTWQQLPIGGVLVASAVTENTKYQLHQFAEQLFGLCNDQQGVHQVETLEISVSKGKQLAGQLMYQPNLPVTLYKLTKQNLESLSKGKKIHGK